MRASRLSRPVHRCAGAADRVADPGGISSKSTIAQHEYGRMPCHTLFRLLRNPTEAPIPALGARPAAWGRADRRSGAAVSPVCCTARVTLLAVSSCQTC